MTKTIFRNGVLMLLFVFSMFIDQKNLHAQNKAPQYYNHIFSNYLDGEVLLINDDYALVVATGRDLEVYSLKTGFIVKSFNIPSKTEPYSEITYYKPWASFETKVQMYYAKYHGDITDPELVPEPNWDVLLSPEYKTRQSDDGKGFEVILADGTKLFFPVASPWQRGAPHYCAARNSLVIVNNQRSSPYMVDLKIFGLIEVNSKGEIINHIADPVESASDVLIYGSRVLLTDRVYDLASKNNFDLTSFGVRKTFSIHDNHILVCFNSDNEEHQTIKLVDLNNNKEILQLKDVYSSLVLSPDLRTIVRYKVNGESHGLRAFVSTLDDKTIVELVCPDAQKNFEEAQKSAAEYERKTAFNKKLYQDFMADKSNRLQQFQNATNTFLKEATSNGWTVEQDLSNSAKEFSVSEFNQVAITPQDSIHLQENYIYWIVCLSALPMMENRIQFYRGIPFFPYFFVGEYDYGNEFTRDYLVTHTGLIHPSENINLSLRVTTGYPVYYAETKSLPEGMTRYFLFRKKASDKSFELPPFAGATLPVHYHHDFDERFADCMKYYHENLRAEAERQRLETLKKLPTYTPPQPGSALYNLQMQIDAAVPATWSTCPSCGGSGVSSSACSCCSGHGTVAVKRQVFHKMSEKTDEVYRPDGPQGAGYYTRTSPIGYYKTETSSESCECCDGAGLLIGRGVCSQCNGAGRVK